MAFHLPPARGHETMTHLPWILWVLSIHRHVKPALQQLFCSTDSLWDQEVPAEEEALGLADLLSTFE